MTKPTLREAIGKRWFASVIEPEIARSMRALAPAAERFAAFVTTTPADAITSAIVDSIARTRADEA